jgi:hypothetical protein
MQLFEFFEAIDDDHYKASDDKTKYELDDTRKSRLTLEMINDLRMQIQARRKEKQESVQLYQKMYGSSVADSAESI